MVGELAMASAPAPVVELAAGAARPIVAADDGPLPARSTVSAVAVSWYSPSCAPRCRQPTMVTVLTAVPDPARPPAWADEVWLRLSRRQAPATAAATTAAAAAMWIGFMPAATASRAPRTPLNVGGQPPII